MDWRALGLGVAFVTMWASAFTSARIIVTYAPPFLSLSMRFLVSACIALAIGRALGQGLPRGRAQWVAVGIFGLCQNALYLGLNFLAMRTVEASLAAIIASMLPLLVAAFSWPDNPGLSFGILRSGGRGKLPQGADQPERAKARLASRWPILSQRRHFA